MGASLAVVVPGADVGSELTCGVGSGIVVPRDRDVVVGAEGEADGVVC